MDIKKGDKTIFIPALIFVAEQLYWEMSQKRFARQSRKHISNIFIKGRLN